MNAHLWRPTLCRASSICSSLTSQNSGRGGCYCPSQMGKLRYRREEASGVTAAGGGVGLWSQAVIPASKLPSRQPPHESESASPATVSLLGSSWALLFAPLGLRQVSSNTSVTADSAGLKLTLTFTMEGPPTRPTPDDTGIRRAMGPTRGPGHTSQAVSLNCRLEPATHADAQPPAYPC